jgi:hypothetical protein
MTASVKSKTVVDRKRARKAIKNPHQDLPAFFWDGPVMVGIQIGTGFRQADRQSGAHAAGKAKKSE